MRPHLDMDQLLLTTATKLDGMDPATNCWEESRLLPLEPAETMEVTSAVAALMASRCATMFSSRVAELAQDRISSVMAARTLSCGVAPTGNGHFETAASMISVAAAEVQASMVHPGYCWTTQTSVDVACAIASTSTVEPISVSLLREHEPIDQASGFASVANSSNITSASPPHSCIAAARCRGVSLSAPAGKLANSLASKPRASAASRQE
mmetsp:Transcript_36324/g.58334  ORF Transcript_36324/g.58334 Transcript_36324/m.58334 type:complete len:210 (-) Transcript_36324:1625-2254(-)